MNTRSRIVLAVLVGVAGSGCLPAEWGANAVLNPSRRPVTLRPARPFTEVRFEGRAAELRGWFFRGARPRRGLVVYLHGVADNRQSGLGIAERLVPRGYDVLMYDSRAHGQSTGDFCTYGFFEKGDLSRALDAVGGRPAILIGTSMGAAVALQAAAVESRVRAVIAIAAFSDFYTTVTEIKPWFVTRGDVRRGLAYAERKTAVAWTEVSPARSARLVTVPVLLLHGERDHKTPLAHSQRIFAALAGPKKLVALAQAGHDDVLGRAEAWRAIDELLTAVTPE